MVAKKQLITEEEFSEINLPGRHDLVDGELWSMAPTRIPHGRFATRVISELVRHVDTQGGGEVFSGEMGFLLDREGRTILCPDVAFVVASRIPSDDEIGFFQGAPDLAIEVISESERPRDIQTKVARYLQAGSTLVWCVYPTIQQVVVYHQDRPPKILSLEDFLDAEPVIPGFRLAMKTLFRPVT